MRFHSLPCLALLLAIFSPTCFAAEDFVIAKNNQPAASIVLLPNSGPVAGKAAADFVRSLDKMTGAGFSRAGWPVETPSVIIGLASEWAKLSGDSTVGEQLANAAPESFLLRSTGKHLLILGKDANGISHGVYTVLRDLGCRWFFLTDEWEVIPKKADVIVNADRVESPAFKMRVLSNGAGAGPSRQMLEDWSRRNRLGSAYGPKTIYHSYANFVPNSLFKERPDLFAWVSKDGESKGTFQNGLQPCTSNPEVVEMFIEGALRDLRKRKELTGESMPLLSVSPNDGTGDMCRCESCMAVGNYGDCALLLANQVAEAIHEEFPETLVGFLAYGRPSAIPINVKEAHPNVVVGIATNFNWKNSVQRLLQEWPRIVRQAIVREYYAILKWGSQRPDNTMPNVEYLSQSLKSWQDKGIDGINGEMANDWATCGHRFWAFSEFAWNPQLHPGAVLEDFYANAWGEAEEPMRRYYGRWESGQMASPRTLRLAFLDLQEAARLATTPEVAARVDQMSIYLYWHLLKQAYTAEQDEEKKNQIALEGDMLQFRWRNAFMVQLPVAIFNVHRTAPQGFTSEEVAEMRKDALERFLPPDLGEEDLAYGFSLDLVPAAAAPVVGKSPSMEERAYAYTTASYLFRADAGEKIEVVLTGAENTGTVAARPQTRPADPDAMGDPDGAEVLPTSQAARFQLWFLGSEGREQDFVEEQIPDLQPGKTQKIVFQAPHTGVYRINSQVMDKVGRVHADFQGRPFVLAGHLNRRKDFLQPFTAPVRRPAKGAETVETPTTYFFFVPPGVHSFVVHASSDHQRRPIPITFTTINGDLIQEVVSEFRKECLVTVPEGRDGSIWALRTAGEISSIALDGVPPWLSNSPTDLLVPREFAENVSAR